MAYCEKHSHRSMLWPSGACWLCSALFDKSLHRKCDCVHVGMHNHHQANISGTEVVVGHPYCFQWMTDRGTPSGCCLSAVSSGLPPVTCGHCAGCPAVHETPWLHSMNEQGMQVNNAILKMLNGSFQDTAVITPEVSCLCVCVYFFSFCVQSKPDNEIDTLLCLKVMFSSTLHLTTANCFYCLGWDPLTSNICGLCTTHHQGFEQW